MKILVGGAISVVIGIILMSIWFSYFLQLLAGTLPLMLLIFGSLALYLGFDELKETWKNSGVKDDSADEEIL